MKTLGPLLGLLLALRPAPAGAAATAERRPEDQVELREVKSTWSGHSDRAPEIRLVSAVVRNRTRDRCVRQATGRITFLDRDGKPVWATDVDLLSQLDRNDDVNLPGTGKTEKQPAMLPPLKSQPFRSSLKKRLPEWKEGSIAFDVVKVVAEPAEKCASHPDMTPAQRKDLELCREEFFAQNDLARPYYALSAKPGKSQEAKAILDKWCRKYALGGGQGAPFSENGHASKEMKALLEQPGAAAPRSG